MPDPFTLLGVEPRYDLDLDALERQHRQLSRALHPDRFAGRPAGERRAALGRAIEVNQAWRTLSDPVARAEALLATRGVPVRETGSPDAPPEFLMEIMEERENLAEARAARNLGRVRDLSAAMRGRENGILAELTLEFAALDPEPDPSRITSIQTKLGELRYCRRFLEEASSIEDDLL